MLEKHPELRHKLFMSFVGLFVTHLIAWNVYIYSQMSSNQREFLILKAWINENFAKKTTIKSLETKIDSKFETITQRFDDINKRLDFIILLNQGNPHDE
ncbi:hypothetical protein KCM76_17090 [Zooshikella marina]|uniref:hypothetical protein n=1 Tax=Zooshikella ganghwensis TaxID=202772 RepID=UPI00040AB67A|nr:hypothetical protein [Zooshikella ganghwensis]MBU2707711.1 hypothetical protein [Zooshikella ganghwensis]